MNTIQEATSIPQFGQHALPPTRTHFYHQQSKLWEELPSSIRQSPTLPIFKKRKAHVASIPKYYLIGKVIYPDGTCQDKNGLQ